MRPSDYLTLGWSPGKTARNKHGNEVLSDSSDAIAWSLSAAILRCEQDGELSDYGVYLLRKHVTEQAQLKGYPHIVAWEDDVVRTVGEVNAAMVAAERKVLGES